MSSSIVIGSTLRFSEVIGAGEVGKDDAVLLFLFGISSRQRVFCLFAVTAELGFVEDSPVVCSFKSVDGVRMDGDDGEDEVDDAEAVILLAFPETVGGVGVRVLTPEVSEAGETTLRDLRLPFCWFEAELKDGVN